MKKLMTKIGVILPSRGTVFSRTMESVFENVKGKDNVELFMSHDLPIPICFNSPTKRALDSGCDLFWYVEEDMLIPPGTLDRMLALDRPVVSVDYADRRSGASLTYRKKNGEVLFTGMGCMLVKREVLEKMEVPWFRRMVFWLDESDDGDIDYIPKPDLIPNGYGTQDAYFHYTIHQLGYKTDMIYDIKVGHMILDEKGQDIKNNGTDDIRIIYPEKELRPARQEILGREALRFEDEIDPAAKR